MLMDYYNINVDLLFWKITIAGRVRAISKPMNGGEQKKFLIIIIIWQSREEITDATSTEEATWTVWGEHLTMDRNLDLSISIYL